MKALKDFLKLKWQQFAAWTNANLGWPKWYFYGAIIALPLYSFELMPQFFGFVWLMTGIMIWGYGQQKS